MGFQSLAIKAKVQFPGVKLSLLLFVQFVLLKLDMQLLSLRAVCGMAKATLLSDENLPPAVCQHAVVLSSPPGLVGGAGSLSPLMASLQRSHRVLSAAVFTDEVVNTCVARGASLHSVWGCWRG